MALTADIARGFYKNRSAYKPLVQTARVETVRTPAAKHGPKPSYENSMNARHLTRTNASQKIQGCQKPRKDSRRHAWVAEIPDDSHRHHILATDCTEAKYLIRVPNSCHGLDGLLEDKIRSKMNRVGGITASYRNSYKHNICLDMLREGYHRSFSELSALIHKLNAFREAEGPGSDIWQQKTLEEQHEKLDKLQCFLTRAEAAQRAGLYEEVYNSQLSLACYFKGTEDKLLSDYFFETCLKTTAMISSDERQKEAEANANLGLAYEEKGQLNKAVEHYEAFYQLSVEKPWQDEDGCSHYAQACENLWRIYTLLADKMLECDKRREAIKTLIKAFEIAKEGGDRKMEGLAAYRVALAYHANGDPQTAIKYLQMYLKVSELLNDDFGLSKAYEAMSKALVSVGNINEAIRYLEMFVEVAKRLSEKRSLVDACKSLGVIYNTLGRYDLACEYISQAYDIAITLSDLPLLEIVQVHFGIAKAHSMMTAVCRNIEAGKRVNLDRLVIWKNNRIDMFNEPITDASSVSSRRGEST
uniref:Tetratricopeptide repeat protein 29 n=1 Tax=Callorhinchus milii TaxID=7868 RepID=A0A4W3HPK5_CALMI